jgi:ketosteroid isomerase-like protein
MIRYAWFLSLAAAVGCAPGRGVATVPAPPNQAAVTDSARGVLSRLQDAMNRRDVAGVLEAYPDTESIVSAVSGELRTSRAAMRDQLAAEFRALQALDFRFVDPIIEAVGPEAAAVTARYVVRTQGRGDESVRQCGVWSGVVAQRAGRYVVLQEHQSVRMVIC